MTATGNAPALTREQMRDLLRNPEMLAEFAEAAKDAKELEAQEVRERFESLAPALELLVGDIADTYEQREWFKRDKVTKKQTDQVSGVGYHVTGTMPVTLDGRTREARVTVFVKWSPNGGSAPADVTGSDS